MLCAFAGEYSEFPAVQWRNRFLPAIVIPFQQCEKDRVTVGSVAYGDGTAKLFVGPQRKALAVALIALVGLAGLWWAGRVWNRRSLLVEARASVLAELDPYANALTIDLSRRFDLIYGFGAWVSVTPSRTELAERFEPFARRLHESVAGVRNMSIAPDGAAWLIFPRAGNEAILGRNLFEDPRAEVREDAAQAKQSRKIVISGPYEMAVGGFGVIARLAIYRQDQFWGLVNVALDLPPILAEAKISSQRSLQLALRDRRDRVFFGDKKVFDSDPVIHRVDLPDGHWDLAAIPLMGWEAAIRRDLVIFDIAALTVALLLSAIAYLLAYRDARLALRVKEGTEELTAELEQRKIIESELRAAEERYQSLVNLNPDALMVVFNQKIVFANTAALRLFRAKSLHDLLGRSPFDLIHPDDRGQAQKRHRLALERGVANEPIIQRRLCLDGSLIYVETVGAPLAWEGGMAVQVIMRDLTEQRKMEHSLHSLIETTQDAVVFIDRQARIVMFNASAERAFGFTQAEVAGQKVNMLMAEPYATEHDGYIARYESTGEARAIGRIRTVSARRKSGEVFPIELSVTQIASGEEVNYAAFIRDISEKVKLQQQAMENERLATIGTMAAKFGHELGNPLNGMSLTIQLLEQRLRKLADGVDPQVTATLARLKSEIARLNTLLLDFRSLSRKETYNFQSIGLASLVGEAIEMELPQYAAKGVEVETRIPATLPPVIVDIDKMKQVILNLAKNAVEAMPRGGKLTFSTVASDGAATLEVSDTGTGIPREVDIFEPFFTTKSYGTGIGLTIVRQIVAAHGGSIAYRSEPGKGTTVLVTLPVG
jgi:two-component system sensor kinase FixL